MQQGIFRSSPTDDILINSFEKSPIFSVLPVQALHLLARAATRKTFRHNDFVYMQDDRATHLFLVISGNVRLSYLMEDGSSVIHSILPPGESFGELGVYENGTYCDMATAAGSMIVACVPINIFQSVSRNHPPLADALCRTIAKRYRSYIFLTRDLSLNSLSARLAQALLRLSETVGTRIMFRGESCRLIGAFVTQADLGLMARGSRGNVNRALKSWERAGLIALADRCIVVIKPKQLDCIAFATDD